MELLRERGRVGEEQGTQKWFHSGRNKVIKYEQKYGFYGKRSDAESMNLALVWSFCDSRAYKLTCEVRTHSSVYTMFDMSTDIHSSSLLNFRGCTVALNARFILCERGASLEKRRFSRKSGFITVLTYQLKGSPHLVV